MAETVNLLLERRRRRSVGQQASSFLASMVFHGGLALGCALLPGLFAEPPEQFTYVAMTVVSPALLGSPEPEPTAPLAPPAPEPEPPSEEPRPAPVEEGPVLRTESRPGPEKPPPRSAPAPARPGLRPPQRQGSPFGQTLGAASSNALLGVEDPNFTYGYYLDRVVTAISGNWVRPPVGSAITEATFYFRIQRDGEITDLRLTQSSSSERFDEAARRAIEASSPLPPLPVGYKKDHLGINLIVK